MKPGNGRPIQSLLVIVFRVASPIAASPRASAATRMALDARGVVGKLSAMAAPWARECSVRGRAGANAGRVLSRGGDGGEARVEACDGRAPGGERGEGGCGAGERKQVAEADVRCEGASPGSRCRDHPRLARTQARDHTAVRIDDPRDAGGGGAHEVAAGLDGAEGRHREVLPAGDAAPPVEPTVVGDVHEKRGPRGDRPRRQLREQYLVADGDAERDEALEHARLGAGAGLARALA